MAEIGQIQDEAGAFDRFDFPCMVIGFTVEGGETLLFGSWWHENIEANIKSWERPDVERTMVGLGKQLTPILMRALAALHERGKGNGSDD